MLLFFTEDMKLSKMSGLLAFVIFLRLFEFLLDLRLLLSKVGLDKVLMVLSTGTPFLSSFTSFFLEIFGDKVDLFFEFTKDFLLECLTTKISCLFCFKLVTNGTLFLLKDLLVLKDDDKRLLNEGGGTLVKELFVKLFLRDQLSMLLAELVETELFAVLEILFVLETSGAETFCLLKPNEIEIFFSEAESLFIRPGLLEALAEVTLLSDAERIRFKFKWKLFEGYIFELINFELIVEDLDRLFVFLDPLQDDAEVALSVYIVSSRT